MKASLVGAMLLFATLAGADPLAHPEPLVRFAERTLRGPLSASEVGTLAREAGAVIDAESAVAARGDSQRARIVAQRAMLEYLIGFSTLGNGTQAEAEPYFADSVRLARESIDISESSEAYRVLADSLNQLLDIRSAFYKMANAGPARDAALRAVALDPHNALAHLSAAGYLAIAPAIVGGSLTRARHHLDEAESASDGSPYERFLIAVWRGRLAAVARDRAGATAYFMQAFGIFPDSWWLASVAASAGVDLGPR